MEQPIENLRNKFPFFNRLERVPRNHALWRRSITMNSKFVTTLFSIT